MKKLCPLPPAISPLSERKLSPALYKHKYERAESYLRKTYKMLKHINRRRRLLYLNILSLENRGEKKAANAKLSA